MTLGFFMGLRMIESRLLTDNKQVRFPRSHKKRLRKKWAKDQGNWLAVPKAEYYVTADSIIAHPVTMAKLLRALELKEAKVGLE
jgi:hypothetical protein